MIKPEKRAKCMKVELYELYHTDIPQDPHHLEAAPSLLQQHS